MEAVMVEYRVKEDFVETNKANIAEVMEELRRLNEQRVRYTVFTKDDGRTFVHVAVALSEEGTQAVAGLDTFRRFKEQLARGAETQPVQSNLALVNSTVADYKDTS